MTMPKKRHAGPSRKGRKQLLSPRRAMMLRMRRKGNSAAEIAALMGISTATVYKAMWIAMKQIREAGYDVDDWMAWDELQETGRV